ncbi:glycoside hydrolase family 108 protein [Hydrogenophaga aromaticivorans]|uniref:glycoside hydrolase family 108 protein n=1 Tax=Hydrogenophaga aromaticivorans TaxID=2610898 RepID=UPI001FFD464D|nr:glycosyl hydrolase 108 family protein [Hydrogenophaga aromaticivorans]
MSMPTSFDECFRVLLGTEGGYVDHPADPGGATRWGVTERVARAAGYVGDMREFPESEAKRIYHRQYWAPARTDELPPAIRQAVFDAAVNSGVAQSAKWLQRAIGAKDDGVIGSQTIMMARASTPDFVLRRMLSQRLRFMTDLKTWPHFSRGWARRIADMLEG